ncbi:MAG: Fic family protein [Planctomycetota bacterium]
MRPPKRPPDIATTFSDRLKDFTQVAGDPAYRSFAQKSQDRYEHWDKVRHQAAATGLEPELAWAMIKTQRQFNSKPIGLTDDQNKSFTYWLSDTAQHELMMIDRELAGNVPKPMQAIPEERQEWFIIRSFMEEAISSSLLEGAPTTRRDAKQMLRSNLSPRSAGERMVANNYNAMLFIREQLHTDLSTEFVHELHRILTHQTMPEDEVGRWRSSDEHIGVYDDRDNELMHDPPGADDLPKRMQRLFRFANRKPDKHKPFLHPVVHAITIHFQLGYEHPYCDGNGRVARALFYWAALRNGYWLFEYLPISAILRNAPVQYSRSYLHTEHDDNDLGYFLSYQLNVISRARIELAKYLEKQAAKRRTAEAITRNDSRLNMRQRLLIQRLHNNPGTEVSISSHQKNSLIAYATSRADLMGLEEYGYLTSSKSGNKLLFRVAAPSPK